MVNLWKNRKLWIKPPNGLVIDDFQRLFNGQNSEAMRYSMHMYPDYFTVLLKPYTLDKEGLLNAQFIGKWRFHEPSVKPNNQSDSKIEPNEYLQIQESWYNLAYVQKAAQILGLEPYLFIEEDDEFRPLLLVSEDDERRGAIGIVNSKRKLCHSAIGLNDIAVSVAPADLHLCVEHIAKLRIWFDIPASESAYTNSVPPINKFEETGYNPQSASAYAKTSMDTRAKKLPGLKRAHVQALTEYTVQYSKT